MIFWKMKAATDGISGVVYIAFVSQSFDLTAGQPIQ